MHECTIDLRKLRGKEKLSVNIRTQISRILVDNFCKEPKLKYDKLTIVGLPKKFNVFNVVDYLCPDEG